ncbi:MAG: phage portal protein [Dehalococcoidia bacterium]
MLETLRTTLNVFLPQRNGPPQHKAGPSGGAHYALPFRDTGVGPEWQAPVYGEYYARSADVYAAVKLRAEAVSRPPLIAYVQAGGQGAQSALAPAGADHPVQRLLDTVNPWLSTTGLLTATETYLSLWGAAFWYLERTVGERSAGGGPVTGIWPLRPDRVRVVRDAAKYVAGFVYSPPQSPGQETPLLPAEVVWFRYFNPLEEMAGFSPLAAARLTADMGIDALRFNREFFRNGAHPQDLVFRVHGTVTEDQADQFYAKLDQRFRGPGKSHRPIITGDGWEVERLGIDQRDMEWLAGLRWSLETVARTYGVPLPLLEDFSHATLNNVREARRLFWEKTVVPELMLLQGVINDSLLPRLGPSARGVSAAFDLSVIEGLSESESERTQRHVDLVKAGILTVNEVRRERGLPDIARDDEAAP